MISLKRVNFGSKLKSTKGLKQDVTKEEFISETIAQVESISLEEKQYILIRT